MCRCLVPECESIENATYNEDWIKDVLPGKVSASSGIFQPEICSKYIYKNETRESNETCAAHWFDHEQEKCNKWVFDLSERTIVNDVSASTGI